MINVVGVRFRTEGKVYYFDPGELEIKRGDHIIVETARGLEYGTVSFPKHGVTDDKVVLPLKPVIRIASPEDDEREAENRIKEKQAIEICREKIEKYGLEMKLVATEYTFDRNKLLFYFTADGRVDFRELVKDLASVFRTRIELRQIGVRDETKMKGGIGICGRCLCCSTYLSDFAPVSIRMAKDQNLSLNPTKISGACGRLMCCLKNEQETYEYLNKQLPKHGEEVSTIEGLSGVVQTVSVLRQRVKVMVELDGDEKELREYPVEELSFRGRKAVKACPKGEGCARKAEHHPDHTAKLGTELSSMDSEEAALAAAMDSSDAKRFEEKKKREKRGRRDSEERSDEQQSASGRSHKSRSRNNRPKANGEKNKEQKFDKPERKKGRDSSSQNSEKNDRNDKTDRTDRNDRTDRSERGERRNNNRSRGNNRYNNDKKASSNEQKNTGERTAPRRREGWDNQFGGMNAASAGDNAGQSTERRERHRNNRNRNRNRRPSGNGQNAQSTQQKQKAEE